MAYTALRRFQEHANSLWPFAGACGPHEGSEHFREIGRSTCSACGGPGSPAVSLSEAILVMAIIARNLGGQWEELCKSALTPIRPSKATWQILIAFKVRLSTRMGPSVKLFKAQRT